MGNEDDSELYSIKKSNLTCQEHEDVSMTAQCTPNSERST